MTIPFACPCCNARYEVGDDLAGKTVLCRECERRGQVPDLTAPPAALACPNCRQTTELPAAMAGRWARCPACSTLARVGGGRRVRPTRRRALLAAVGVFAAGLAGTGLLLLGGRRASGRRPEQTSGRRRREPEEGKDGQAPGQPQQKGPGRRRRRGGRGDVI